MNSLSNTAKKLDKILEIAHIVLSALAIACAVGVALIFAAHLFQLDPDIIGVGYENFDIGFLELTVAEAFAPSKWLILVQASLILITGGRLALAGREGIGYVREILNPMKEEKPFDSIVSTNLKKLAKLSIELGILYNILLLIDQIMTVFVYDIPGLLVSEKITHVGGMFKIDLTFLIYWAFLMLLSYVFRYGEELQQLSDETI